MDNSDSSATEPQNHPPTDYYTLNPRHNDDFLPAFDSNKILKFKQLNLLHLDHNKARENIANLNETYINSISTVSEKRRSLQSTITNLTDSTSNTLKEIQINEISFNLINEDVSNVYNEIEESKNTLNSLRSERSQLESLLSSKTEEFEQLYKDSGLNDAWSLKLSHLQLLLGITISNDNGSMKISFTRLSNSNPYRSCYILLKLNEDKFTGILSEPKLKNFSKLVSDLNNGLDFGSFLCTIRECFKNTL